METMNLEKSDNEIMIGSIISRVKMGNDDLYEISKKLREIEYSKSNLMGKIVSQMMCKNILF